MKEKVDYSFKIRLKMTFPLSLLVTSMMYVPGAKIAPSNSRMACSLRVSNKNYPFA